MQKMVKTLPNANRVLSALRKMFNMAAVWDMRPDGSNPCRHIPRFPERGKTRLITDAELKRPYAYLNKAEDHGPQHPFILLAIRLQFEFAARRSEILKLEWAWVDLDCDSACTPIVPALAARPGRTPSTPRACSNGGPSWIAS
ncbi:MAG: hypothetical protein KIT25_17050 [Enhydrobacter sp.]|nr:MAG: hypothetical protein KIT25_17050 [Enhydrobacter sp.]